MKKSEPITCPGLFYNTSALDGIIYRLRTPGGIIDSNQCRSLADLSESLGDGFVQITNRANLQVRAINKISFDVLQHLQAIALAAQNNKIDHLRNIMSSPTAGIDQSQLIDTLPLVKALDKYISSHPHLAELPPKFSVGFNGGEAVSIANFHNEILFVAVQEDLNVYFRLYLSVEKGKPPVDAGILLKADATDPSFYGGSHAHQAVEQCLPVAIALMEVYLEGVDLLKNKINSGKKPRLRQILQQWGLDSFLDRLSCHLSFPLLDQSPISEYSRQHLSYGHIGIHFQQQQGLSYVGLVIPLGRLTSQQIKQLANLAEVYGDSTIRLTPWQNLLIPNIPNSKIAELKSNITALGLSYSPNHPYSALVACTGNTGCASSATDTKNHALALAKYLEDKLILNQPVNIHFTGCSKSCAQNTMSDITLLGTTIQKKDRTVEGYHVYLKEKRERFNPHINNKFGQLVYSNVLAEDIPALIEQILQTEHINTLPK
ncbi:MAG: precorrin-3B synthase [Pleurocapsa sp.]